MPINDPIKGKRVAPASLAFDPRKRTGGSVVSTYQSSVTQVVNQISTATDLEPLRRGLTVADRDAEMRAKNWVSDWHRAFHWDVNGDIDITNNTWSPIQMGNEHMRAMGAEGAWQWTVPYGWEGSYFIHPHISINVQAAAAVTFAALGIVVNGSLRIVVDRADIEMAGDNVAHMRDIILHGGANVSVAPHDVVRIGLFLAGAAGTDTYTYASSVTGYVSGFRVMCGFDHIIESSGDNNGYVFT